MTNEEYMRQVLETIKNRKYDYTWSYEESVDDLQALAENCLYEIDNDLKEENEKNN